MENQVAFGLSKKAEGGSLLAPMQQRLMASSSFDKAAWLILDDVMALHGAEFGSLQFLVGDELLLVAHRGFRDPFLKTFQRVNKDDGCVCGRALRKRRTVVVADVETDTEYAPFRDVARGAGYRSVQSTPLFLKSGAFMGVVSTHFVNVHQPTKIEMNILRDYSIIAAERLHQLIGTGSFIDCAKKMNRKLYPINRRRNMRAVA